MRGTDKDKIILDILKEESKTRKELCDEAVKRGVPEATAYRHITKLIDSEEIREGKLELVTKIEEANRQEVDSALNLLIEEDNENVIYSKLKELTTWAYDKRLVHFPNVIQKLASLLEKENVITNKRNLNQIFECLEAILFFEQSNKGIKWKKITNQLVDATIDTAGNLLHKEPNSYIIGYLGRTNREYAIDAIFRTMAEHNIEADKNEFSSIANALRKDRLSKEHKKMINEKLDEFLRSKNERLINLALVIRERITQNI